jgi:hypothetical protein
MFSKAVSTTSANRPASRVGSRIAFCSAVAAAAAIAVSPAPAFAEGCPSVPETQAFKAFNDTNWYTLAPGGDFEGSLSGWTLNGGAAKASGSEPYKATGTLGKYSLALPSGASAQSPFVCVDKTYRTLRFFLLAAEKSSAVTVAVVYKTPNGPVVPWSGNVNAGSSWAPSEKIPTYAGPASAESNGTAYVAIRFTAKSGSTRVDDLFIDPRMR